MKRSIKYIILGIALILTIFFGIQNDICRKIIEKIFLNKELNSLLVTLIAGLFGFIVAIIPFAIHLLNQNNDFIDKLKKENNFNVLIKPLFNRLFYFLINMFALFIFLLIFAIVRDIILEYFKDNLYLEAYFNLYNCIISVVSSIYFIFVYMFLAGLYRLIRDLKSLVQIFLNIYTKESKNKL